MALTMLIRTLTKALFAAILHPTGDKFPDQGRVP